MSLGALFLCTHTVLNVNYMSEHIHSVLAVGNILFGTNVKPSQLFQLVYLNMEDHKHVSVCYLLDGLPQLPSCLLPYYF